MGNEPTNFIPAFTDQEGPQPGPSWAKRGWLDTLADSGADLVAAMDPTEMRLAVQKAAKDAGVEAAVRDGPDKGRLVGGGGFHGD